MQVQHVAMMRATGAIRSARVGRSRAAVQGRMRRITNGTQLRQER